MRNGFASLVLYFLCVLPVLASDAPLDYVPHAKKVGAGKLSVLFWDVYDATLYAPYGRWSGNPPFALSIHYFRSIKGTDIADRSTDEMRKQGFADDIQLNTWHARMREIFPDVTNGTNLIAVCTPKNITIFYDNDQRIGAIEDVGFSKQFFNIWLSDKTSEPALRKKLLGLL